MNVDLHLLEKDETSLTYEWSIQENGVEQIHGWGRGFASKEGTVILGYQTQDISKVPEMRSIWLQVLKQAKQR